MVERFWTSVRDREYDPAGEGGGKSWMPEIEGHSVVCVCVKNPDPEHLEASITYLEAHGT